MLSNLLKTCRSNSGTVLWLWACARGRVRLLVQYTDAALGQLGIPYAKCVQTVYRGRPERPWEGVQTPPSPQYTQLYNQKRKGHKSDASSCPIGSAGNRPCSGASPYLMEEGMYCEHFRKPSAKRPGKSQESFFPFVTYTSKRRCTNRIRP